MIRSRVPKHAKPVAELVQTDALGKLAAHAGRLAELDTCLNRVMSPTLAAQVRLANMRDGKLVFLASSPAWATRLRYAQVGILEAAQQLGLEVRELLVKVVSEPPAAADEVRPAVAPLSETAARHLALAARLLE
ncbi:MAG: DUF721 domain-containing protein [Xanthomonadales bacterium]|nr:DUF721 domain-containing protein [Xanthomonadales bacterium]